MKYTRLAVLLGDQLFPDHDDLQIDEQTLVFLAEDYGLCTHFAYHQHKLVLFLSAMRSHADTLRAQYDVHYVELSEANKDEAYEDKLAAVLEEHPGITELVGYAYEDHFFADRMTDFAQQRKLKTTWHENPSYFTTRADFADFLENNRAFMATFYQQQRKRLRLLVDENNKPLNGQWSFDADNRQKLPKKIDIPELPMPAPTAHTKAVKTLVAELFPDHPGQVDNFWLATTREQALDLLDKFLKERFEDFGPYEDAFEPDESFLFHSVLSPYINLGILPASEVVQRAVAFFEKHDTHYPSVEGFVRQIIGWREFIRGMYHEREAEMRGNFFDHQRRLTDDWWKGTTEIAPVDDCIQRANEYGYLHHIERLMVMGNIMLLSEIHPDDVYRWFMEFFVDSADWVMVANVYGMSQFAGGGIFATKPYICGANYWSKMSHYSKKADWADIVDGLYWRFIDRKRDFFLSNPRMAMMVRLYDKQSEEKQIRQGEAAEAWLAKYTR